MTATLADDGILVSHFQAVRTDDVKDLAVDVAKTRNVAVIVPSARRAEYWKDVAAQTLDRNNIAEGVEKMRLGHVGLTVLINKYDGIDLPGKSCELLILDGLPEVYGLAERTDMAALEGTELQLLRQVQRVEQGMGRGVRSSEDHCVVLLLGPKLTNRIHMPSARQKFTPASRAQLDLGRQVTEQVRGRPVSDLRSVLDLCFNRDKNWVETSRSAVVNAQEDTIGHIDPAVVELRAAFDCARAGNFRALATTPRRRSTLRPRKKPRAISNNSSPNTCIIWIRRARKRFNCQRSKRTAGLRNQSVGLATQSLTRPPLAKRKLQFSTWADFWRRMTCTSG